MGAEPARSIGAVLARAIGLGDGPRVDPGSILVPLLMPIGDVLLCQPALAALRRRYPHARLTALVTRERAEIVQANPDVDALLIYDFTPGRGAQSRLDATLAAIYARRFDMVVSFSTAGNCVAIVSAIPRQIWQRLPFFFWLWGSRDPAYLRRHAIEHYWDVVAQLGITPRGPADHIPRWSIPPPDRTQAQARLQQMGIDLSGQRPLIMLHPGAAGFYGKKRWPVKNFSALAVQLCAATDAQIIVLGGPDDVERADQIVAASGGCALSLAGVTGVRASIALIERATVYVGCDTGMTHFAVALGVSTVAIFGVSCIEQFAPRPADPRRVRVLLPTPVLPPAGYFIGVDSSLFPPRRQPDARMETITVAQVYDALLELLTPPVSGI